MFVFQVAISKLEESALVLQATNNEIIVGDASANTSNDTAVIDNSFSSARDGSSDSGPNTPRSSDRSTEDLQNVFVPAESSSHQAFRGFSTKDLRNFVLLNVVKVKHHLTAQAGKDVATLVDVVSQIPDFGQTKYKHHKILDAFATDVSIHHVCPNCKSYIGEKTDTESDAILFCTSCQKEVKVKQNLQNGNFFLYLSMTPQLQALFSKYGDSIMYANNRKKRCKYAISDIFDGTAYKKNHVIGGSSLNFSYDGAPIFKCSLFSIYPILVTINELSPKMRKKHVMLAGLWFGKKKPIVNEYFKPFVNECNRLHSEGFNYCFEGKQYNKKVRVLVGVCDTKARCELRNAAQFNGSYGCGLCNHKGERVQKGKGFTRVYPVDEKGNPFGEGLRTHEEALSYNIEQGKGMKGRSILCDLQNYNIVENLPPDWMHAVGLGVCRQFGDMWFNPKETSPSFNFVSSLPKVDSLLLEYKPTLDVSRTSRKMSERCHWKAHEWIHFLLYSSIPVLKQVLPAKYFRHWALLVEGISILVKDSILKSEVYRAENCLLQFVQDIPVLYDKKHVSFNVHLLTHLASNVLKWGPLWTHSAFPYEDYNQQIKKTVKSSQHVMLQISDFFRLKSILPIVYETYSNLFTPTEKVFIEDMLKISKLPDKIVVDGVELIGGMVSAKVSRNHLLALKRLDVTIRPDSQVRYYERISIEQEIIHSSAYKKVKKRNSYTVLLKSNDVFEIEKFIVFESNGTEKCFALGYFYSKSSTTLVIERKIDHLIPLTKKDTHMSCTPANCISTKVCLIPVKQCNSNVAGLPLNNHEYLL